MIKVFISHTSSDHPFVEWMKTRLERENLGLDIFVDDGSVFVGDDPQKMIDEVKKSIIFLPILSDESIQKEFVQNELKTAFVNATTHVFPVKLKCDDANIPEEIKTNFIACDRVDGKIYEDFSDEQEWDIHYENLRRAIFNKIVELGLFRENTKDYYQDCEHLDLILQRDEPTILEIKMVIDVYLKKEAYQRYFFNKLKNVRWLKYLKLYGYLRSNPQPIEDVDSPGLFKIPQWNALEYLERVSSKAGISDEVINDLLDIITSVTDLKDASGQHIDNYRTWYYFTKILINLPTEKITEEIINLISIWLDSKFDTSLQSAEITGKLLLNFLNSSKPEDWKKAERLIDIVTAIKWVSVPEKKIIYEREEETRLIIEPHWLKKGFEKNFNRIGAVCSIGVVEGLAKKLLRIFSRYYDQGYDIDYKGNKYEIAHKLSEDGIHQIVVYTLEIYGDWESISRSNIKKKLLASFNITEFDNRENFVTEVKKGIIQNAFPSLTTELDEPISSIYNLHDYTYIRYKSLYTSPEHISIDDTDKILIYILKEILAAKAQYNKAETSNILHKFINNEYPYPFFKRLVLFIIGSEWFKYKEYFFRIIGLEEIRWFKDSDYSTELSVLLKNNFSKFNLDEKETLKKIIEKGPRQLSEENPDQYAAYWKQKWLSIIKDDPLFAPLFEEQKKVTGIEKEKFSFGTEFKTSSGFGPSPLTADEVLNLTNTELAKKLKEFRSEKKWEGMTIAAFSESLKTAVITNPGKFTEDLNSFEDSGFIYIYKILDGLGDCWKAKKIIEWGKILDFITTYIKKEAFWKDEHIIEPGSWLGGANHEWIMGIIAELIQEGTGDDSWAFSEDHFNKAKDIVFNLIKEPEEKEEIKDYVFHALNTPCGKLITALVYLALRIARVNEKKGVKNDPRWSEDFKGKFEELLGQKVVDVYTSFGRLLPQLAYLDRNWVIEKIKLSTSDLGSKYWVAFFEGYLSIGRVYDNLYELMMPHYRYALFCDFKEKRNKEHLIQHICIGYLRGNETLDNPASLFKKIIDRWNTKEIQEIINYFCMQRNYLKVFSVENETIIKKIILFWKLIYEKYKDKDEITINHEDKQILSSASKMTSLLSQIDAETYEWLMLSSPYVHEDYSSSFFVEYLDELKEKGDKGESAKYIGDIYLKMLDRITPDHDQKHIRSIVGFLYDAGETDSANKICNIYGARGLEFLRDIYEKHSIGT